MALTDYERELHASGYRLIAGIDEAGRGALAGSVVAAAVILPPGAQIDGLADSKKLRPEQRERIFSVIQSVALGIGIGVVDEGTIDRMNILRASLLAMEKAVSSLPFPPPLSPDRRKPSALPPYPCPGAAQRGISLSFHSGGFRRGQGDARSLDDPVSRALSCLRFYPPQRIWHGRSFAGLGGVGALPHTPQNLQGREGAPPMSRSRGARPNRPSGNNREGAAGGILRRPGGPGLGGRP